MQLWKIWAASGLMMVSAGAGAAEVVRCEVVDRTHRLMPEWIEYKLNERETVLEIRDSVGQQFGVDWVRGMISENTERRREFVWEVGMVPVGPDWPGMRTRVSMHMTRLSGGEVLVTGVPTVVARGQKDTYRGTANCGD